MTHNMTSGPITPALVTFTIPLVLAATFLAMWYWNIGLHKVSLGSLIIALGLLVGVGVLLFFLVAFVVMVAFLV